MTTTPDHPSVLERLKIGIPLSAYTSLHVGGPARGGVVEVTTVADLAAIVCYLRQQGLPFYVLGGGTNVLIDDAGLDSLVIVNRARDVLELEGDGVIRAASGLALSEVVEAAAARGLTGLEFATGIPGSFGGGIVGNAGAWGQALGDILIDVDVVAPSGEQARYPAQACGFVYRDSLLKTSGDVVLSARVQTHPGDPEAIRTRMAEILEARAQRHPPPGTATAGSYFRNVQPTSAAERRTAAGYYLEQAGAKQLRVGGAAVSDKHANIVVNTGGATACDILALTAEMRRRVQAQFGIDLEPEVRYIRPGDHF